MQNCFAIGEDQPGVQLGRAQHGPGDLFAEQKWLQGWTIKDLLGPTRPNGGGAVEFKGPAKWTNYQVAAEISMLGRADYRQIAECRFVARVLVWHGVAEKAGPAKVD